MKLEKEGGGGAGAGRSDKERRRTTVNQLPSGRIIDSVMEPTVSRAAVAPEPTTINDAAAVRHGEEGQQEVEEEETAAEAEAEREMSRLSKKLKKLNGISSTLNMLTVMSLTWHLVHLGHTLDCV